MYTAVFRSDRGRSFSFGYASGALFDIDPLCGVSVSLSSEQSYAEPGEILTGSAIPGVTRRIAGTLFGPHVARLKRDMAAAFAPTATGKLYFNDKYYCECVVRKPPEFTRRDNRERFSLQVFCAYPYWLSVSPSVYAMGTYEPAFSFPVLYDEHAFGVRSANQFVNCKNTGEEPVAFDMRFSTRVQTTGYRLTNVHTLAYVAVNDTLEVGQTVRLYRQNGALAVEKTREDGTVENLFASLDEGSTLFFAQPGDNVLLASAEDGADSLVCYVTVPAARAGVYDGIE